MDIEIKLEENKSVKHNMLGDILIAELEKEGYSLFYNDVYDCYSTIDFKKDGYKFNIMVIQKEESMYCSTHVYRNIFSVFFKKYRKEKLSSFNKLIESILNQRGIIRETTKQT